MFQYLITYIQHQSFSIQHEFSLIPVNLEQNLTVLQKKRSFKQTHVSSTSSSFASFSAFNCRLAYDIANMVSTTVALLFPTKIDFPHS